MGLEPGWPPPTRAARYLIGTLCLGFAGVHALLHELVDMTLGARSGNRDWLYMIVIFAVGGFLLIWPQPVIEFVTMMLKLLPWRRTSGATGEQKAKDT